MLTDNIVIPNRDEIKSRISEREYDVVVIGGGITGAGVLRDATLRGLNVALFEKGDFSSGTSSESTKLLHGGLRYLKNYEFKLVREAALERKIVADLTPNFSTVKKFMIPMYKWTPEKLWMLRIGLWFYDLLAWPKQIGKHKTLSKQKLIEQFPIVEGEEDLIGGAYYHDVETNDSRLVLLNLLSGVAGHADVLNYTEVTHWERDENGIKLNVKDVETGEETEVHTKLLVNATGPWSHETEALGKDFDPKIHIRRTKGVHLTVKKKLTDYCVLLANKDDRPIFILPWDDFDIVGTTDTDWKLPSEEVKPEKEDLDYILDALNTLFPTAKYTRKDVYSAWAGLRPLVYQPGKDEKKTSREHTVKDYGDVITIAGGKMTTHRKMAKDVMDRAIKNLGLSPSSHKCVTDSVPFFSTDFEDYETFKEQSYKDLKEKYNLSEKTIRVLLQHYGTEIPRLTALIDEDKSLTEIIDQNAPFIMAQVVYSTRYEFARTVTDVLRRRFQMAFYKGQGLSSVDKVAETMAKELNWSEETKNQMKNDYVEYVKNFMGTP